MKTEFQKYWDKCSRYDKTPQGVARIEEMNRFQGILEDLMQASKHPINERYAKRLHEIATEVRGISDTTTRHPHIR